ncbi:MAG: hypothetical protein KJ896_00530 [Nanoarchaeota archaeon]|nr:hypothetical protein [Nanoarchaeota archaeon]
MNDVSNKTIVALLAVALVVSIAGTLYSVSELNDLGGTYMLLTGAATDSGTATITIQGTADVTVTDAAIAFGTGYVNASCADGEAWISSDGEGSGCWLNTSGEVPAATDDSHTVENNGTTSTTLSVTLSDTDAEAFLCEAVGGCTGSTTAAVYVKAEDGGDGEAGACSSGLNTTYESIATHDATTSQQLCAQFNPEAATDVLEVNYNLTLPPDMPQGLKTGTVTYTATAVS